MMRAFSLSHHLRRAGMPAAVAAAVLLVAGCGGGGTTDSAADPAAGSTTSAGSSAAVGVVLDVTGAEFSFAPMALTAAAGKTTIRFTNKGAAGHDFVIKALDIKLVAEPGKTAEATVTLKPGTYKSYCSVPGHSQSGMRGTLVVS